MRFKTKRLTYPGNFFETIPVINYRECVWTVSETESFIVFYLSFDYTIYNLGIAIRPLGTTPLRLQWHSAGEASAAMHLRIN